MNIKNIARIAALGLVMALSCGAQAQQQPVPANLIQVEQGTHKLLRRDAVARVAVGDPAIADVSVVNRRELLVTGKSLGVTSLLIWASKDGMPQEYRIRVGGVKDPLRASAPPDPELKGAVIDQGIALEGTLPNLLAHRRAKNSSLQGAKEGKVADRSSVALETQVMTDVKIAEVSRSTLQTYGLNFFKYNGQGSLGVSPPGAQNGLTNEQLQKGEFGTQFTPVQNAFNILLTTGTHNLFTMLSLLEQKGLAHTLAEPSLVATSGQTASYLAGGEFPVPVAQGGSSAGSITIQYKEFGVRLSLTPTILSRSRIALKVAPEVSDLDFSAGIQIAGVAVPSLIVRRTDTTVELGDGETFVISGLVSSNLVNSVNKVPWLGDIPVLGAFFKSTSINRQDKELVMVVTPHLVRPLTREAKLPPLPGQKYDNYDPNFAQAFFLEHGNFDTGFSK
ncbi:MAG: type II and III secretion system protein family protein [Nevskiaceae bacterium]|nr:MAG: type II and III secretion system protein family protein [Nevskiaceae bacterium]